jgi:hypothetical protein
MDHDLVQLGTGLGETDEAPDHLDEPYQDG